MISINKDGLTDARRSMNHYQAIYRGLDPKEISARCNLLFNGGAFSIMIMGKTCRAAFPDYTLLSANPMDSRFIEIPGPYEKLLFIRYLCEGRYTGPLGKQFSYREIPWGDLYFGNFDKRCIKRLARGFGNNLDVFRKAMEENPDLKAQKLDTGDAGYRFEFCSGLFMSFIIWAADDEFPASAQILFDDNFPGAFAAEDIALACDVAIDHLKVYACGGN